MTYSLWRFFEMVFLGKNMTDEERGRDNDLKEYQETLCACGHMRKFHSTMPRPLAQGCYQCSCPKFEVKA